MSGSRVCSGTGYFSALAEESERSGIALRSPSAMPSCQPTAAKFSTDVVFFPQAGPSAWPKLQVAFTRLLAGADGPTLSAMVAGAERVVRLLAAAGAGGESRVGLAAEAAAGASGAGCSPAGAGACGAGSASNAATATATGSGADGSAAATSTRSTGNAEAGTGAGEGAACGLGPDTEGGERAGVAGEGDDGALAAAASLVLPGVLGVLRSQLHLVGAAACGALGGLARATPCAGGMRAELLQVGRPLVPVLAPSYPLMRTAINSSWLCAYRGGMQGG